MSELAIIEALDNLDKHGVYTGVKDSYALVCDAARRFASLTSPETIEKAAKVLAAWFIDEGDEEVWDNDMSEDDRRGWSLIAEAVLRSVEEGET